MTRLTHLLPSLIAAQCLGTAVQPALPLPLPIKSRVASAQELRSIGDRISCSGCEIERYQVAAIHDAAFPDGALVSGGDVNVNADGTFFVVAGPGWDEMFRADESGSIRRRVGRLGDGPGEFRWPQYALEGPEHYLITDPRLGRLSKLDKQSLGVVGSVPFPPQAAGVAPLVLSDGSIVLSADISTRALAGNFIHILSPEGEISASFYGTGQGSDRVRPTVLAEAGAREIWIANGGQYSLERWTSDGVHVETVRREAPWFVKSAEAVAPGDVYTRLAAAWRDSESRLWVHLVERTRGGTPNAPYTGPMTQGSIVEVLDVERGEVLARAKFTDWSAYPGSGGFYAIVNQVEDIVRPHLKVWAFRLSVGMR